MLLALSTGHKLGLALVAGCFILFAVTSSFVFPRLRSDFPGRRGLRLFIFVALAFFVGMLAAVEVFGAEPKESARHAVATQAGSTATVPVTPGGRSMKISVTETEWKIKLSRTSVAPGSYAFDLTNRGAASHNLTINGPQVSTIATATIAPGSHASVTAVLVKGTYDLYCSIPGHKAAGMDMKLTVS